MNAEDLALVSAKIGLIMEDALVCETDKYKITGGDAIVILASAMSLVLDDLGVTDNVALDELPSVILRALYRKKEELCASN